MTKVHTYKVYFDQMNRGWFESTKSKEEFRKEMQESLKHLHPLNMSDENAIEYRKRFENLTVYVYLTGEEVTS